MSDETPQVGHVAWLIRIPRICSSWNLWIAYSCRMTHVHYSHMYFVKRANSIFNGTFHELHISACPIHTQSGICRMTHLHCSHMYFVEMANSIFNNTIHELHTSACQIHKVGYVAWLICIARIQGGKDPCDAISCRLFSAKEPLIIGLFCGKWPVKISRPMGLCHPVLLYTDANLLQGLWIWGTYVTWLIDMCDVTHSYVWDDLFICVIWRIHMRDMTRSCVWEERRCLGCDAWHDSLTCATWLIHVANMHVCDMTHPCLCHDAFIRVTWLVRTCDMTHSYEGRDSFACLTKDTVSARHDSLVCATWRIHMCDMTHLRVYQEKWGLGLIHMCDMTHSDVWHDSLVDATCDVTHWCVRHDSFTCVTWFIHMCDMIQACVY